MSIDTSALRAAAVGVEMPGDWYEPKSWIDTKNEGDIAFIAAANPAVVLELLDEVERLRALFRTELRRSAVFAAELDRWIREGPPGGHNRPLSAAQAEVDHGEGRDDAGAVAGFRGDGVEVVVEMEDEG